jgi:hypothetical protein
MNQQPHKASVQPKNTFFASNIKPGANANLHLSGGSNETYYYSLGNQSTVPFVQFQGSGGTQKTFTWGELIEVKAREQIQVFNASYMPGDIQIQSGHDYCNAPARVSVPIEVTLADGVPISTYLSLEPDGTVFYRFPPGTIFNPTYPCDTRRCKNAYLSVDWFTGLQLFGNPDNGQGNLFTIIGQNQQHSFIPDVPPIPPVTSPLYFATGKKYYQLIGLPSYVQLSLLPLGFNAFYSPSDNPMTLADYVFWQIQGSRTEEVPGAFPNSIGNLQPLFYYVLEY